MHLSAVYLVVSEEIMLKTKSQCLNRTFERVHIEGISVVMTSTVIY